MAVKKTTNKVTQTNSCANVIKTIISEAGDEFIPATAPGNSSSSIGYEM